MSARELLDELRNKDFFSRTDIERAIVIAWEDVNGYEDYAMKAAAELAQLRADVESWKKGYNDAKEYHLGREGALTSELAALRTRAETAEAEAQEWRDYKENFRRIMSDEFHVDDEHHCTCVPMLRAALEEAKAVIELAKDEDLIEIPRLKIMVGLWLHKYGGQK